MVGAWRAKPGPRGAWRASLLASAFEAVAFSLALVAGGCDKGLSGDDLVWVAIPGGPFDMGCSASDPECDSEGEQSELPAHRVAMRAFELTKTEITQYQYWKQTGQTPRYHPECGNCPVEYLERGHADATAFCQALGGRLPTEAEWEYAARAGTTTRHYCGDDDAWYLRSSRRFWDFEDTRGIADGFRCARDVAGAP